MTLHDVNGTRACDELFNCIHLYDVCLQRISWRYSARLAAVPCRYLGYQYLTY